MSETPDCPYCGTKVHTDRVMDYDNKIRLRCNNCGGFFEFLPGFGSFILPDHRATVSKGILSHRMTTNGAALEGDLSLSRALLIGGLCCCTIAIIIPVVLSLLLALLG